MTTLQKLCSFLIIATLILFSVRNSRAGSATWKTNPESGDWLNANNWSVGGPPNGSLDIATFGASNVTAVFLSDFTEVNGITFNSDASPYTIRDTSFFTLTISGVGITNNSATTQSFVAAVNAAHSHAAIFFTHSAAAGIQTAFSSDGAAASGDFGGIIGFRNTSTADHGAFINNAGTVSGAKGGVTEFFDSATAGSAVFTNNGTAVSEPNNATNGGSMVFYDFSTAANATITSNGGSVIGASGGEVVFFDNSSAGAATLIANGGTNGGNGGEILFTSFARGGKSRIELFGNGKLDVSFGSPGLTIGSIEGTGNIFLGDTSLFVGSNNVNTTFSGVIQDGGEGLGVGGSLTKIGSGTLILSGTNTYTGSTTVDAGKLIVNGSITSAVTVNGGTFAGSGITKSITVNKGGTLAPGNSPGILNVTGDLMLSLGSTYLVDLDGAAVGKEYDQTKVVGAISLDDATLVLSLGFTPVIGTTFTVIDNDLGDLVSGMFDGLSEGSMFVSGGQTFTISYHGGDGNDVALTSVVPEPQTWILIALGLITFAIARGRRCRKHQFIR